MLPPSSSLHEFRLRRTPWRSSLTTSSTDAGQRAARFRRRDRRRQACGARGRSRRLRSRPAGAAAPARRTPQRPSSSAVRTRVDTPVASARRDTSSWPFGACRPGEVTRIAIEVQLSFRARRTCALAASAASETFFSPIRPPRSISSPSPSWTRSSRMETREPSSADATRRRTVFAPTSTIPTRTPPILTGVSVGARLGRSSRLSEEISGSGTRRLGGVRVPGHCA